LRQRWRSGVGPGLALLGLAPFLVARLLWEPAAHGHVEGFGLSGTCSLLETTGVPCAGCGASRAFFHFVHGDSSFLSYNPFWVAAFLAAIGYGIVLTVRSVRGRPLQGPAMRSTVAALSARPWVVAPVTLAVLAVPWTVALLNVSSIRGG
jgi:hypothetical protein